MEKMIFTKWKIGKLKSDFSVPREELLEKVFNYTEPVLFTDHVAQVHEILIQNKAVSSEVMETGNSSELSWVSEYDWFYVTEFTVSEKEKHYFLSCKGLDTVCDIFLNGKYLGISESMYLPFELDVTEQIVSNGKNYLMFYFHSHEKMLKYFERMMPEEYRGHVPASAMLLKSHEYGADPARGRGYWNIGIFDEVCLEGVSTLKIENTDIEVKMSQPFYVYDTASVEFSLSGSAYREGSLAADICICESDGSNPIYTTITQTMDKGKFTLKGNVTVDNPKLWWPRNYGSQPLYRLCVKVSMDGTVCAESSKTFGIRDIRQTGNMTFMCNGRHIRLFGGDISPIYGPSNVFNEQVAFDLVEKLYQAGMNIIRVWGPSKPYPDRFYDKFDELGILVWQDFPTGGSELPCDEKYQELLVRQAEVMLRRLKHHPSIFLWCGGNENIYMNEFFESSSNIGYSILTDTFRDLCNALNPSGIYHASCPYGSKYTNDPDFGDSHGSRAYRRFLPGEPYGVFYSENIRVYPPQYKSMKRWLKEELWDENFVDVKKVGCQKPMPLSWAERVGNNGEEKFGPIHEYYAADNAHDLIYKYTAAASQDIYQMYARTRRGKPHYKSEENNFCQGFMLWKTNDPWPNFYCALVDYYGECAMTYYAVKRAIQPIWIDLEVDDRIYLWGVNDTLDDFRGTVVLTTFRMDENRIDKQTEIPVALLKDTSQVLTNLDFFGPIFWHTVLHASLKDENGTEVFSTTATLRHENLLTFPDAELSIETDGDFVTVHTDHFARCVELSAGENGEAFGWVFEDNFFNLLPFETKKVAILKRGDGECIRAKAQYSSTFAVCDLKDRKEE